MIHNIPKPIISPEFTIEDIHKIREWNYERFKDATVAERLEDLLKPIAPSSSTGCLTIGMRQEPGILVKSIGKIA